MMRFLVIQSRVSHPLTPLRMFALRMGHGKRGGRLWAAALFAWFFISALYMQRLLNYTARWQVGLAVPTGQHHHGVFGGAFGEAGDALSGFATGVAGFAGGGSRAGAVFACAAPATSAGRAAAGIDGLWRGWLKRCCWRMSDVAPDSRPARGWSTRSFMMARAGPGHRSELEGGANRPGAAGADALLHNSGYHWHSCWEPLRRQCLRAGRGFRAYAQTVSAGRRRPSFHLKRAGAFF